MELEHFFGDSEVKRFYKKTLLTVLSTIYIFHTRSTSQMTHKQQQYKYTPAVVSDGLTVLGVKKCSNSH